MGKEFMVCIQTDALKCLWAKHNTGTQNGQICVIFTSPGQLILPMFGPGIEPPGTLAYVGWFTCSQNNTPGHKMYPVSCSNISNGICEASVIEVNSNIHLANCSLNLATG